jgi:type I restriction enzyme M protein
VQQLERLNTKLDNLNTIKKELEEEHGADNGVLQDVSSAKAAQLVYNQTIINIWDEEDKIAYSNYNKLTTDLEKHKEKLELLNNDDFFIDCKGKQGNITKTGINTKLKNNINREEINRLKECLNILKNKSDTEKQKKEIFESVISKYQAELTNNSEDDKLVDLKIINKWLELNKPISPLKKQIKQQDAELDTALKQKYPQLTVDEIKQLVINDKWLADLDANIETAINRIAEDLATRVNELHNRYAEPLPQLENQVSKLSQQVTAHLQQMGVAWN